MKLLLSVEKHQKRNATKQKKQTNKKLDQCASIILFFATLTNDPTVLVLPPLESLIKTLDSVSKRWLIKNLPDQIFRGKPLPAFHLYFELRHIRLKKTSGAKRVAPSEGIKHFCRIAQRCRVLYVSL